MWEGTRGAFASVLAAGVALMAVAGSAVGQAPITPIPKDCIEGKNCYSFPCPGNCLGSNITCINSTHIACCCTTAGTSTCSCKTLTACDDPPVGSSCAAE